MRRRTESGQAILLMVVACGLVLIGALGLSIDVAQLYTHRQIAQVAADAAAQSGIMSIFDATNGTAASPFGTGSAFTCTTTDGRTPCVYARSNGFGGTASDTVVLDFPTAATAGVSTSSLSTTDPVNLMRATVTRNVNTGIMRMLGASATKPIKAIAIAAILDVVNPVPILVLHPTLSGAFHINGTPTITICGGPQRSIQVNSSSTTSISISGASNTVDLSKAGPLDSGACDTGTGADFGDFGGPATYPSTLLTGVGKYIKPASPINDPLLSVAPPAIPGTAGTQTTIKVTDVTRYGCPTGQTCTLYSAGLYASGIKVKNDFALFTPGIYYITSGGFNMDSNSIAQMATGTAKPTGFSDGGMLVYNSGSGTFNFNANAGKNDPGIVLKGSDDSSLYKGILFFEDRTADAAGHSLQGGGILSLTGTIYLTNTAATMIGDSTHYQGLSLQGNPGSTTTIIGEIITDTLSLGGNAGIKMNLNPNSTLHIRQIALVK